MHSDEWIKIKAILNDALALQTSERQGFLDEQKLEPSIRSEVESLLAFETEAEDAMKLTAVEFAKDFLVNGDAPNPLIGTQIGNYRILREIGYGGMGVVYLAERADGKFEQKVALKLLKRELNTAALRRRFENEREILASLEHANIARLLDAGTTDDHVPFIAMEYVEGLPIDEYCEQQELDLGKRLDLFRKVCSTVNFAHRNLIVHRDLKPSNILVNDEGVPKLLDFGISKVLSETNDLLDAATVTNLGVMTPSYASPEQLQSKSVTTASDIYSLGVILYELLSGHRPFEGQEAELKAIFKAVLENDPRPPSELVDTISKDFHSRVNAKTEIHSEAGSGSALRRNTDAEGLRFTAANTLKIRSNSLKGDLDNIVLKALRKEPDRRYLSAENLAEDIHRHQRGLPVTARPNTYSYRVEKFVSRNRAAVIGAAVVLIAIVAGLIATLWQASVARAERAKAEERFNDVRKLANSYLFEIYPEIENLRGSVTAKELLVKNALEYLDNLSQETGSDRALQRELAAAYQAVGDIQGSPNKPNIGDTEGAFKSYEKALGLFQDLSEKAPNDITLKADVADTLRRIGELHSNGGEYDKAGEFLDRAVVIREGIVEQTGRDFDSRAKLAELLRARGIVPFYDGDNKKAIEFYSRAKDIAEALHKEQPTNVKIAEQYAYLFVAIGEAQGWDNDFEGASKPLQTGLDMLVPLGRQNPNDAALQRSIMLAHNKRAENYQDLEQFEKSIEMFTIGTQIADGLLKADPRSFQAKRDVAMCNKKLAQALDDAGRSKESLERLEIARQMFAEMAAADPKNTEYPYDAANTRYSIGQTYVTLKDYENALDAFSKAKDEFNAVLKNNPNSAYAMRMSSFNLNRLGNTYVEIAKKRDRATNLQKALENLRAALDNFYKMKNDGKLVEVDTKEIPKLEQEIAGVEKMIGGS